MNDTLTIRGFVGNDPQPSMTSTGVPVLNFRVGSSRRRFDRHTQSWIDAGTNWYAVSAYRQLAEHAKASLRKGDPVIITGRIKFREWENANGAKGASLDLDAEAIGHDLQWGTSNFMRISRPAAPADVQTGEGRASATDEPGAVEPSGYVEEEPAGLDGELADVWEASAPQVA
ncbi:single-stranded DNA-binding protein [Microbacterium sp. NPDC055903]